MTADIEELERKLRARDKTIRVLSGQLEQRVADNVSAFTLFEQNIALEDAVAKRTGELEAQRRNLEQALQDLKQTQAELLQAQKLQAIGQLAGGIAHEINTPAQYIGNNLAFVDENFRQVLEALERIRESLGDDAAAAPAADHRALIREALAATDLEFIRDEVPQALGACREGVRRITSIVAAMRDFSQSSRGSKQPLDLNRLLLSTLEISRAEWKSVARLDSELEPELPPVEGLRDELGQVFLNLIVNAAHAIEDRKSGGEAPGLIRVVSRRQGGFAEIEVRDNGCGIPKDLQGKIFEPFFTTKEVGRGVGQGLAIAYSVVTSKHHGQLTMDSEEGKGTTFTVRLPF